MIHKLPILAALALSLTSPADAPAADRGEKRTTPWIHIEVLEGGQKEAKVKVNLPLKLARTALEMAPDDVMTEGRIRMDHCDFTVSDLRKMWKELRAAGDAEFVTIEEKESTVRVYRKGDRIFANVDEREGQRRSKDKQVRVEVPVALVDALLTGNGDTLNVDAAVAQLEKMGTGEVVHVQDGDDSVRIWID